MHTRHFRFQPVWKEKLIVTQGDRSFALEFPMGIPTAYLPTQAAWCLCAPDWARESWTTLEAELRAWCRANGIGFIIDDSAAVNPA